MALELHQHLKGYAYMYVYVYIYIYQGLGFRVRVWGLTWFNQNLELRTASFAPAVLSARSTGGHI